MAVSFWRLWSQQRPVNRSSMNRCFAATVQPFFANHCIDCHGTDVAKGGIDLESLTDARRAAASWRLLASVREQVHGGVMPPKKRPQPSADERAAVTAWIEHTLDAVATADAGAPGPVPLRHLTNAEYDAAVRDLTGVAFDLAQEFPADSGGGAGFTNTAAGQQTTEIHLSAWIAAAKRVADSAEVLPSGIRFAPAEVGTREPAGILATARERQRAFYRQDAVVRLLPSGNDDLRYGDYLLAAWKHQHRAALGLPDDLAARAAEAKLEAAFLANWWTFLTTRVPASAHLDLTRDAFAALPAPQGNPPSNLAAVRAGITAMERERFAWFPMQRGQQNANGDRAEKIELATKGVRTVWVVVTDAGDDAVGDRTAVDVRWRGEGKLDLLASLRRVPPGADAAERAAIVATLARYERAKPSTAIVVEAPAVLAFPVPPGAEALTGSGRIDQSVPTAIQASVQFAALPRSPTASEQRIIPGRTAWYLREVEQPGQQKFFKSFGVMRNVFPHDLEYRRLQLEANANGNQPFRSVYHFSDDQLAPRLPVALRPTFEALRTDTRVLLDASGERLAQFKPPADAAAAERRRQQLAVERDAAVKIWEDAALRDALAFADRAWRRPLAEVDAALLTALFRAERSAGRDVESAARAVLVRVLASPRFLYRDEPADEGERALDGWAMASRLSFLLWSSLPDAALRADAAAGRLDRVDGVVAAAQRLRGDPRARRLIEQCFAQWFHLAGFDQSANPDPGRFPQFTPAIRQALYDEVIAFGVDLLARDGDLRELLHARHTFLNEELARYYGISGVKGAQWRRVDVDGARGGVLGMGSVLTRTSYPLRTSPVLRGNWILEVVLGLPTPPPPPNVPVLPTDDAGQAVSLRAQLERHRADPSCASCHDRIDPLGFALERFDAIGRLRQRDANGGAIEDHGTTADGTVIRGPDGLRAYLKRPDMERAFLEHAAGKLLAFALGRGLEATDRPLIRQLAHGDDHRIGRYLDAIVASRQFRFRRGGQPDGTP